MGEKNQNGLLSPQNLWKIILLVCVAVIAEGIMLQTATSGGGVNWHIKNSVVAPKNKEIKKNEEVNLEAKEAKEEKVTEPEVEIPEQPTPEN